MTEGRPLRFLVATLAGWAGLRAFLLWPAAEVLAGRGALAEAPAVERSVRAVVTTANPSPIKRRASFASSTRDPAPWVLRDPMRPTRLQGAPVSDGFAESAASIASSAEPRAQNASGPRALAAPIPTEPRPPSRWSASAWAIARPNGTGGGLGASQLGGSQAGARLAFALGRERRVSLVGRIATPLEGRGREASLGVEWRPTQLPIRVFAERRFALDGGRGGPSAGMIGGLYEPLPGGFRLEAYGQAGMIKRDRIEGFADGAARAARAVATLGPAVLDLGAGAWGGKQRGAERLDVGPTLGVAAPVGGRTIRLTIDYRARIAGRARPGSGPAVSLGTDF